MLIELITADYVYNTYLFELINCLIIILTITTVIPWKHKAPIVECTYRMDEC